MSKANPRVREIIREMCAGNSSLAADVLAEEFVIIPRSELPACEVVDSDSGPHVDCGSDWGTWKVQHSAAMRKAALEYVAAWQTAEEWNSKAAVIARRKDERRNELAAELFAGARYKDLGFGAPDAIDRIIDLESAA